ncbi:MAG TPA: uroporphyrinogen decarboxylase [Nitrospirae bacterium]|nr:uroporphyrinogen decarboxylase [Nitrospirota bacterium]
MNDTFLKVCRGEKVSYTPIWIMRQAGRYLPEYQEIRKRVDFLTLCKDPDLASEVTIQPVEILGVDAAILFSDILIPLEPMGIDLEFSEKIGPIINNPVRDKASFDNLLSYNPDDELDFVKKTIKNLKSNLKVPLIGFSGAPFTLATYLIEGGTSKNFINTKKLMYGDRVLFEEIMAKLTIMIHDYLLMQIKAGVDAIQIFDTWLGIVCPEYILKYILKYVNKLIDNIKSNSNVPIIYFPFNCSYILKQISGVSADVIGIDWRIYIDNASELMNNQKTIQGNLDPCVLFATRDIIKQNVEMVLNRGVACKGHIFNLGHGILPETPVDNVKYFVDIVHKLSQKGD